MSPERPFDTLVFDTMCISHFAIIERLDVLGDLLSDYDCYTTTVVREEIKQGAAKNPHADTALELLWLKVAPSSGVEDLRVFTKWLRRVGHKGRGAGEASVFAFAESCDGIAITDDREATRVARNYGMRVHGTVWLLAQFCRADRLPPVAAGTLVDMLRDSGMRLPCTGADFEDYVRKHGLL
ncbi:hypothetical protein GCM10010174_25470 [Kutzneria viridogrisea]|uniref:PIN domain-containing protein n=2 Tax=Kutzneria TaxID=43356 RepID=W5W3X2_9PSEU|nr:hypothetical protein [Kutzneria albida]AHH95933.1 hypothetical protein KALB_2565 [Kutzneria albida DSM 43870]MBA8928867.1 putative nucleic acid-binding protein [Kutzneria viridogrisea]